MNETVTTASANGLSITTQTDKPPSNGTFDATATDVTVINANGSRTETVTDTSANGTQTGQTVTATSANGLYKTTTVNIDGKVDYTATDTPCSTPMAAAPKPSPNERQRLGDRLDRHHHKREWPVGNHPDRRRHARRNPHRCHGHQRRWQQDGNRHRYEPRRGTLRDQTVISTNATGTSVTIGRDTTGLGYNNQTGTITTAANGSTADTVSNYAQMAR